MFIPYIKSFKGILDKLNTANNAVFIFSPYKRLTKNFEGNLVKVQRTSDYTSKWFGYDGNGDLDTVSLLAWVGANDGLVEEVSNQANTSYNSIQTTLNYKPKIVVSGVLQANGVLFDGNNDYLNITKYNDVNIKNSPLSIYTNIKSNVLSQTSYIFSINRDSSTTLQYSLLHTSSPALTFAYNTLQTLVPIAIDINPIKSMVVWSSIATNDISNISDAGTVVGTLNTTLPEYNNMQIACRSAAIDGLTKSTFFNGNIKTIIIFNSDITLNYNDFVNAEI